jgi:hypothetical protein
MQLEFTFMKELHSVAENLLDFVAEEDTKLFDNFLLSQIPTSLKASWFPSDKDYELLKTIK